MHKTLNFASKWKLLLPFRFFLLWNRKLKANLLVPLQGRWLFPKGEIFYSSVSRCVSMVKNPHPPPLSSRVQWLKKNDEVSSVPSEIMLWTYFKKYFNFCVCCISSRIMTESYWNWSSRIWTAWHYRVAGGGFRGYSFTTVCVEPAGLDAGLYAVGEDWLID
jgi:hypothetical protein